MSTRSVVRKNPWPFRAVGFILVAQAMAFGAIVIYREGLAGWAPDAVEVRASTLILGPVAGLALVAALGFFLRLGFAWFAATLAQALALAGGLWLHFQWRGDPLYPAVLAFAVLVVLYQNSAGVRPAFGPEGAASPRWEDP